jgi:hypothetical protein
MVRTPEVFISHTTRDVRDSALAHKLAAGLASQRVRVFVAPHSIPPGERWEESLVRALVDRCTHFLVILSESAVRSPWVLQEIDLIRRRCADDPSIKVLPLRVGRVGGFEQDEFLATFQDLPYSEQFATQLRTVASAVGLPPLLPALFRTLITDTTRYFVGRDKVFLALQKFLANERKGSFLVLGHPGQGKTTIVAEYVRRTGCPAHFNMGTAGIDSSEQFLESVRSQLVTHYDVAAPGYPGETPSTALQLAELLEGASQRRPHGEPFVLAIDALDEVRREDAGTTANILQLPPVLPDGVFLLLSGRPREYRFVSRDPQVIYDLAGDEAQGRDIELFLTNRLAEREFQPWLDAKQWTLEEAAADLARRSENNFMYLHYVLQEIARGQFQEARESLPVGLRGYYQDHWRRMGMAGGHAADLKHDVLQLLAVIRGPVTIQLLAEILGCPVGDVSAVIVEWSEFLHSTEDNGSTHYRLYHSSFQDFLLSQEAMRGRNPNRWLGLLADHFGREMLL